MFLRPGPRVRGIAQSLTPGQAEYLIVCNGEKGGQACGEWIWVKPSDKSQCEHCGRVYPSGYFGHVQPRTVEK